MTPKGSAAQRKRGYSYSVTDEQIRRWRALPTCDKLQWLEDANRLLAAALSPKTRAIQDRFRRGEL
jgi:hypothetical protein